ncbi:unnamed protein product [Schistosoma curassoni]|uniref:Uncharacterized protein n=1 Tax=Schistosoma curassoni TaxID=6186 RepID=A0A183L1F0_9TREM|nr:unnamed protein product [Schistosoma curassoni]
MEPMLMLLTCGVSPLYTRLRLRASSRFVDYCSNMVPIR